MLSDVIRKHTGTFDQLASIVKLPTQVTVSFDILYLGFIPDDLFHVEIKLENAEFGWLYSKAKYVVYKIGDDVYEIELDALRDIVHVALAEKLFADAPIENALLKTPEGRIEGWVSTEKVRRSSHRI